MAAPVASAATLEQPAPTARQSIINEVANATPVQLNGLGRNIILDLMTELRIINANIDLFQEFIDERLNGDEHKNDRKIIDRLLNFEARTKAMNNLATALAKLVDAAPGKKQEQQDTATQIAAGGDDDWGDDLAIPGNQQFN